MGLAFLPWERLPAYVFGPFCLLLNGLLLFADSDRTIWSVSLEIGGLCFGAWVVWYRYAKGVEPLWTEEQRTAAKKKQEDRN
jgi:hypothetical protein